jgi:Skp family chaperone for outer membrane proteins
VLTIQKILVVVVLGLCGVAGAYAQTKIIAVDPEAVIFSTNIAKAKMAKLSADTEITAVKANAELKIAEIKNLEALEKKDGLTWSKEQREANVKKYQALIQDFQVQKKKLDDAELAMRQELFKELAPKFEAALKQIMAAENISMVVNPRSLVQLDPKSDYTKKVIDVLNQAK